MVHSWGGGGSLTLSEAGHQLQSPCGSQVDAGAFQLIVVKERRSRRSVGSLCNMTHLHWSTRQLETIQLLQSFFGTLCICKLRQSRAERGVDLNICITVTVRTPLKI